MSEVTEEVDVGRTWREFVREAQKQMPDHEIVGLDPDEVFLAFQMYKLQKYGEEQKKVMQMQDALKQKQEELERKQEELSLQLEALAEGQKQFQRVVENNFTELRGLIADLIQLLKKKE